MASSFSQCLIHPALIFYRNSLKLPVQQTKGVILTPALIPAPVSVHRNQCCIAIVIDTSLNKVYIGMFFTVENIALFNKRLQPFKKWHNAVIRHACGLHACGLQQKLIKLKRLKYLSKSIVLYHDPSRKMFVCWPVNSNTMKPVNTVKPVNNDHLMGYFSAFWSSSRWAPEGRKC